MTPVEIHRQVLRSHSARLASFNQMIAGIDQAELARSTPQAKATYSRPRL